jgi:hypothetical protein
VEQIPQSEPTPKTRDIRAKAAGTNAKYIDFADKLIDERPDLAAEVEAGRKTLSQAQRIVRQEELAEKTPPPPSGKYRVIYADPPWKYNDTLAISRDGLGESYGPAETHYPPMTILELCALPVQNIAEDDAVSLWSTVGSCSTNGPQRKKRAGPGKPIDFANSKQKRLQQRHCERQVGDRITMRCVSGDAGPNLARSEPAIPKKCTDRYASKRTRRRCQKGARSLRVLVHSTMEWQHNICFR